MQSTCFLHKQTKVKVAFTVNIYGIYHYDVLVFLDEHTWHNEGNQDRQDNHFDRTNDFACNTRGTLFHHSSRNNTNDRYDLVIYNQDNHSSCSQYDDTTHQSPISITPTSSP